MRCLQQQHHIHTMHGHGVRIAAASCRSPLRREATLALTDLAAVSVALWAATADLSAHHQMFTLNNLLGQRLLMWLGSQVFADVSCLFLETMAPCRCDT